MCIQGGMCIDYHDTGTQDLIWTLRIVEGLAYHLVVSDQWAWESPRGASEATSREVCARSQPHLDMRFPGLQRYDDVVDSGATFCLSGALLMSRLGWLLRCTDHISIDSQN